MRICPLHKTELIFEKGSKHRLICPTKKCEHIEYTTAINPETYQVTALPFWCNRTN